MHVDVKFCCLSGSRYKPPKLQCHLPTSLILLKLASYNGRVQEN